jgi:hypothetical protein
MARRIMVNLNSQQAGLAVAEALLPLFTEKEISPFFRQFKIRLSTKAEAATLVKLDKIVIYYTFGNFREDGHDVIGDRIVDTITSAVDESGLTSKAAPFFCYVAPGIYWAEEPKYHGKLRGSFTQSRSDIIKSVITTDSTVQDAGTFIRLVKEALVKEDVNVTRPYLHIKSGETIPLGPLPSRQQK